MPSDVDASASKRIVERKPGESLQSATPEMSSRQGAIDVWLTVAVSEVGTDGAASRKSVLVSSHSARSGPRYARTDRAEGAALISLMTVCVGLPLIGGIVRGHPVLRVANAL
jgi:hypothetical protein